MGTMRHHCFGAVKVVGQLRSRFGGVMVVVVGKVQITRSSRFGVVKVNDPVCSRFGGIVVLGQGPITRSFVSKRTPFVVFYRFKEHHRTAAARWRFPEWPVRSLPWTCVLLEISHEEGG
jgi:hypothetical protein